MSLQPLSNDRFRDMEAQRDSARALLDSVVQAVESCGDRAAIQAVRVMLGRCEVCGVAVARGYYRCPKCPRRGKAAA